MGFTIDKANISENNGTISIVVNKVGDTVLTTKVNLTRSYNTTGKSTTSSQSYIGYKLLNLQK